MGTLTLIMFLIGLGGIIGSVIYLIITLIKKQEPKKGLKILGCFSALLLLAILLKPSQQNNTVSNGSYTQATSDNKSITVDDRELLKKSYKDFDVKQRTQFAEIEEKYKKLSDKGRVAIKVDFERLSKERDDQVAKWKEEEARKLKEQQETENKKKQEFINKNSKTLSAGDHVVGVQLDSGIYEVTFNGSGNFVVNSNNGSLISNEVAGSDFGISKYRALFTDGSKIKISGMSVNVKPVERKLMPYDNTSLYAGYWGVGQDITKGRYKVVPISGTGNFVIRGKNGSLKTNEVLGGDIGVKEIVVNLEDNDIINISGLKQVNFIPSN